MSTAPRPVRLINSIAPIRICDNGGWTDTWFAGYGRIFNIGVYPYVEVQLTARRAEPESRERTTEVTAMKRMEPST